MDRVIERSIEVEENLCLATMLFKEVVRAYIDGVITFKTAVKTLKIVKTVAFMKDDSEFKEKVEELIYDIIEIGMMKRGA